MGVLMTNLPTATRNTDPHTSALAEAEVTASGRRATHVAVVAKAVREHQGLVARELTAFTGLDYHETMRRLNDARRAGLVMQGPDRKHNGRACVTWWIAREEALSGAHPDTASVGGVRRDDMVRAGGAEPLLPATNPPAQATRGSE